MATYNQVSYGSQGSDVTELQKLLNKNGYNLSEDGIFGKNTLEAVRNYQDKNNLDPDGVVGTNTWGALTGAGSNSTTPTTAQPSTAQPSTTAGTGFKYDAYQESDLVKQAQAMLQEQMANKPGAYTSPWQDQLNEAINKILNREKFSYDLNGDALYKQYEDQFTTKGKMAMMDTIGQASAMTGGYGNSYAQSVGQQAYQEHLQQLNDKIPELYQLALNQYQMEGDEMYDQLAMLGTQEEQDYGRYRDTVSDFNTELDRLQNQFNTERDYDYSKWADNRDFTYGQYSDDRAYDYQVGRDQVTDSQWQKEFDEAVRQFNFANDLGEFAPTASSGGGGYDNDGDGSGNKWLNSDGTVNLDMINENSQWWKDYAASHGLDPTTGKHETVNDDAAMAKFESTLHSESNHDAIMRDMYGSYKQYVAGEIKDSGLTDSEKAELILKYGIQTSDVNPKKKKE